MTFVFDPKMRARPLLVPDSVTIKLEDVESVLHTEIPDVLRSILTTFQGAVVFDSEVRFHPEVGSFAGSDGRIGLEVVFGLSTGFWGILVANERLAEYLPSSRFAFASCAGGNSLSFDVDDQAVYLLLHDNPIGREFELVNRNIEDFFTSLEVSNDQFENQTIDVKVDLSSFNEGFH